MSPFRWLKNLFAHSSSTQSSQQKASLSIESLEERVVMTTNISPASQLMIELINRARSDPGAEASRLGIDLNEGLAANTISDTEKQALAPNQDLVDAIAGQGHTHPVQGKTLIDERLKN